MRITRRQAQVVLGLLWLLDGALQLQPFMFTTGFAHQIIAPAGDHQPAAVADPVHWAAHLIAAAPLPLDLLFAATQLLLGAALLLARSPRPIRLTLAASIAWALSVWWLGEGLGGLAGLHTLMLTGAPGAVLLYAVVAGALWPRTASGHRRRDGDPADTAGAPGRADGLRTRWITGWWVVLWTGAAVLQALPGNSALQAVADAADGAPGWLQPADRHTAAALAGAGTAVTVALVAAQALIGLAALRPRWRLPAACAAIGLSLVFWVLGQGLGVLTTGQATDPNAAPLYVLLALLLASTRPRRQVQQAAAPARFPARGDVLPAAPAHGADGARGPARACGRRRGPVRLGAAALPDRPVGIATRRAGTALHRRVHCEKARRRPLPGRTVRRGPARWPRRRGEWQVGLIRFDGHL
ncbi:hypothetical protein [Kitasatospora cineracea]|uniref:Uncharacterized protein n=1 Tax=Kitasatospora cineracea TaxID=88074 RepID=A0A8G1ULY3_9ACTN|nr:hypothetical protein [Kitasatospora cineracea]ROR46381.1 hypothetical protein EDD39_4648 [Kitasatospora cineracea]